MSKRGFEYGRMQNTTLYPTEDRKSTRLNSSHITISYAVFCLKKKIQNMVAWLAGNACVPVFNLIEDSVTAPISRFQLLQSKRSPKGKMQQGRNVTEDLVMALL